MRDKLTTESTEGTTESTKGTETPFDSGTGGPRVGL